jgi:Ca2+-binding EF-hand superfamily protein
MPRAGASIALLRAEAARKKETEKKLKALGHQSFRNDVLSRYGSGGQALNSQETARWLSGLSPDGVITDDELRWVLMLGNKNSTSDKRYRGCMKEMDISSMMLYPDAFESVMQSWSMYTKNKTTISRVFQQYDIDQNGSLSRIELAKFLTTLSDGVAPTEEDMNWAFETWDVIGQGEGIETPEILYLINAWDQRPSLRLHEQGEEEEENGSPPTAAPQQPAAGSAGTAAAVSASPVCGQCLVQ